MNIPNNRKIIDPLFVGLVCEEFRKQGRKIVFTNGVFDLLHPGHVEYLAEARDMGTELVVALNTDNSVKRIKGELRPIMKLEHRAEILAALEAVSVVTWFDEDLPVDLICRVRPDVLVKGGDWKIDQIAGREFVESYGGIVKSIPFRSGYSTTSILKKIANL